MEFHEKLQELRKRKGLTQEALAQRLFVSRTAVSKWESGRGYPGIDSLKALSRFFGVTIDELLSGEELLSLAGEDARQMQNRFRDLVFGMMDCSTAMVFFLPFFGQKQADGALALSLLAFTGVSRWLKGVCCALLLIMVAVGVLTLALQNCRMPFWVRGKRAASLLANTAALLLFILISQPYAAVLLFLFLAIKVLILIKRR